MEGLTMRITSPTRQHAASLLRVRVHARVWRHGGQNEAIEFDSVRTVRYSLSRRRIFLAAQHRVAVVAAQQPHRASRRNEAGGAASADFPLPSAATARRSAAHPAGQMIKTVVLLRCRQHLGAAKEPCRLRRSEAEVAAEIATVILPTRQDPEVTQITPVRRRCAAAGQPDDHHQERQPTMLQGFFHCAVDPSLGCL